MSNLNEEIIYLMDSIGVELGRTKSIDQFSWLGVECCRLGTVNG